MDLNKLERLGTELKYVLKVKDKLAAMERDLKQQILAEVANQTLPVIDGKSSYLPIADLGESLSISISEPAPVLDVSALRKFLNDDDLLLELISIKKADLDYDKLSEALATEKLTKNDLLKFLSEGKPTVSVGFGKLR